MKVSYNWLKEYFSENNFPKPEEISDVLNSKSFEVESIEKNGDDYVLDIDILPNRAHDCLCHIGIAREIAINFNLESKIINPKSAIEDFVTNFEVEINDKRCVRYMLREIKDIEVGESHPDLKNKIESIGEKSINNIVDITNIVMFELGQPMHAFDKDKLNGNKIDVRTSNEGENITTLDNKLIELDNDICLITDGEPLAIAGIKGGKKAEVDNNTKNLILESANFTSSEIRKTSKKINIGTESSKRYENELAPELTEIAMNRATELLIKYGGQDVKISNVVDVFKRPRSPYYTGVSLDEINNLLGLELSLDEVKNIFDRLGFEYRYLNTKNFVIQEIQKLVGTPHNTFPSLTYDAPRSFDCSTLTAYVYAHGGKSIPRITIDQLFFGKEISKEQLEPGDLIFSNREEGEIKYETINFIPGAKFEQGVDHVGIYLGEDNVIHSSRYKGCVTIEKLSESDNFKKIVGYRRIVDKDEMRFAVKVPYLRLDIKNEADLVEEVGRVYGYEKIVSKPVENLKSVFNSDIESSIILKIKSILQSIGFSEVITYSFSKKGDLKVVKALASDKEYLRVSLEEGIMNVLKSGHYNADLIGLDRIQVFEIGKVYPQGVETLVLGLGVRNKNFKKPKSSEILKNSIEEFKNKLQILNLEFQIKDEQEFIQIELTDLINQIKVEDKIEIDFNKNAKFETLSSYPFISRDISVWIPNGKGDQNTIFEIVEKYSDKLLKNKRLFDVFEKEGRTSFAVRVVFQSNEKTLNDDEVGEIMNNVYEELKSKEGFEIR